MLPMLTLNSLYQVIPGPSAFRVPGAEVYAYTPGLMVVCVHSSVAIMTVYFRTCCHAQVEHVLQLPHSPWKPLVFLYGFAHPEYCT